MNPYPVIPPPQIPTSTVAIESPTSSATAYPPQTVANTVNFVQQPASPGNNQDVLSAFTPQIPKPKFVQYPSQSTEPSQKEEKSVPVPKIVQPNMKVNYAVKRVFKVSCIYINLLAKEFQVIIIGDAGVGKTCLSFRFCNGRFPQQTEATIGVDFRERALAFDKELIRVSMSFIVYLLSHLGSIMGHCWTGKVSAVYSFSLLPQCERSGLCVRRH